MCSHQCNSRQRLDDAPEIMRFASQLFSEIQYLNDDDTRQDLVVAERVSMGGVWGRPDIRL